MKPSFTLYWLGFCLLFNLLLQRTVAQPSLPLTLQTHKLKQAKQLYQDGFAKKNSSLIAEAYYINGRAYFLAGDYLAAQRWFIKSLRIQEKRGDSYQLGRLYIRLCDIEMAQFHHQESLRYVHRALAIFRGIHSDKGLLRAYSLLAGIYSIDFDAVKGKKRVLKKDSALYYYRKLEYLAHKLNDSLEIASVAGHFGGFLAWHKNPRGIIYQQTALTIYTTKKIQGHRMYAMMDLASSYLAFRQPERARQLLLQAQQLYATERLNEYIMLRQLEENWIHYYQLIGDWKQAFAHQFNLHELEKREAIADRNGAITRLNLEYETEKKEALLKTQQDELALRSINLLSQMRFSWAMATLLTLAVGTSLIFFRLYRQNQRISKRNTDLVKEQNHRVKNNLQVISSLLSLQANQLTDKRARQAVEESQSRVQAMATLQRRLYDSDRLAWVSLPEYIPELVDNVLEAFGYSSIQPTYAIPSISLSADDALPLGLILNELTTNACKYAFPNQAIPTFRVSCHQTHKRITLTVHDNGPGYSSTFSTRSEAQAALSFGMRLIQLQVDQLRGHYAFTIDEGTLFTLEFNVKAHEFA